MLCLSIVLFRCFYNISNLHKLLLGKEKAQTIPLCFSLFLYHSHKTNSLQQHPKKLQLRPELSFAQGRFAGEFALLHHYRNIFARLFSLQA
jgi:hypothetical protein